MDHDFKPTRLSDRGGLLVMKCTQCGWWTSDESVLSSHLITFWTKGDKVSVKVSLDCLGMQLNGIQNG